MTKIEWTEATWNPIVGCSIVSPGCTNCYAMRMAARLEAMSVASETRTGGDPGSLYYYRGLTQESRAGWVWTGKVKLAPEDMLTKPLRRRKPTMWFVNSMSDLFHEDVPDEWIDRVFAVMALTPQHTYHVLTKRSGRMREYVSGLGQSSTTPDRITQLAFSIGANVRGYRGSGGLCGRPLPNVWLGVSAERQQEADERIPDLLATPAAVRFVSAEPLLGPIDFKGWLTAAWDGDCRRMIPAPRVSWVIVGGESGPNARPMHPDWARAIRDQCAAAGVPFFMKQWGEWLDADSALRPGECSIGHSVRYVEGTPMIRVGKSRAGRLLDGREHNDMPEVRP